MNYDIYLVGVGGQGVLTIGDLITEAAVHQHIPVNFYPTKGMAQRGGAVKAQLRLGREEVGPQIPEKGADLVIAMEISESLKALRFLKPGGSVLLFAYTWLPLGRSAQKAYPSLAQVEAQVQNAGGKLYILDPGQLPLYNGDPVPANIVVLAAALRHTALGELLNAENVAEMVQQRWKRGKARNARAFKTGLSEGVKQA